MGLSSRKNISSSEHCYYISKAVIVEATDKSGQKRHPYFSYADDLAIELKLDIGQSWFADLWIGGRMQWESGPSGKIAIGFGGAFKVEELFSKLGIYFGSDGIPEIDQHKPFIPAIALEAIQGKEIIRLRYLYARIKGDLKYGSYTRVDALRPGETEVEALQRLENTFLQEVDKGWPRDYHPELLDAEPEPSEESAEQQAGDTCPF